MALTVPGFNPSFKADPTMPPGSIKANTLNATRVGGLVTVIGAILAVVTLYLRTPADAGPAVQIAYVAAQAAIVVGAFAIVAVLIAVDVRARAALVDPSSDGPGANAPAARAAQQSSGTIPLSQPLSVRVAGTPGKAFAYALRSTAGDRVEYLVARTAAQLQWFPEESIEAT